MPLTHTPKDDAEDRISQIEIIVVVSPQSDVQNKAHQQQNKSDQSRPEGGQKKALVECEDGDDDEDGADKLQEDKP